MSNAPDGLEVDDDDLDEEDERPVGMIFRWRDRSVSLRFDDLGPGDDMAARREIGMPVTAFLGSFGSDSVVVLWWTARRKMGERKLRYAQAEKEARRLIKADELEVEPMHDEPDEDAEAGRPEGDGVAAPGETTPTT